ncbi:MAG TPA: transporter [candidate division Zixibacteria bacterium]|nr:transporter [candidate division Zixibacteria bacterium]
MPLENTPLKRTDNPYRRLVTLPFLIFLTVLWSTASVMAGPPFVTDDPGSLPLHTGELYLFATGSRSADGTSLDASPGIEANYSLFRNTFFHLVAPLALVRPSGGPTMLGPGDLELGFKWRFLAQDSTRPDIGLFPLLSLPTGAKDRGLGSGKTQLFVPLWVQKDFGRWTGYGGGGYNINPGTGNKNFWFTGLLLQRQVSNRLYLGGELFHQTPDTAGGASGTGFNLGGGVTLTEPYQILFSAGRNLQNSEVNQFSFYLALYRTF